MAEINFNTMFDQLSDLEKQQYEGVMGMGGFKSQYEQNPDSPLVTQNPNYEKFKEIADTQAQIKDKGIMGMLNPFSEVSASEVTPTNYNSNYDIASNMYTPEQQALIFGDPNYFNNQKFYKGTNVPVNSMADFIAPEITSKTSGLKPEEFVSQFLPETDIYQQQSTIHQEKPVQDNFSGLTFVEQAPVGITDRNRGMLEDTPGAPTGAYEMIGGTPVAIGDVLGMQQALEKSNLMDEPVDQKTFGIENLLGPMFTLAGFPTIGKSISAYNIGKSLQSGALGKKASSFSKGIRSLGTSFASRMRGINPITGKPNTQSEYERNREAARHQSRVDNVAARIAANKKTLSDPYSIATNQQQRDQIKEAIFEGAKTDMSQGETGYGSCFIAGTKVSMADGTLKNIEDVIVGDKIKGHKEDNTVIKLDPTLLGNRKLYSFNNNQHYFFTSEHPFMTEKGWKSIKPEKTKERDGAELYDQLKGELKVGDKLVTDNGLVEITNIDSKEMNSPEMSLYNFNVSNDNSYIADGYIVHNKGGSGSCCFIMLESRYGDGTMDKVVRKYRDEKMTPRNRRGYYKMARVLVPLMRKSKVFKWIVAKTFADPLVSYGKWYYGENKHGWIFAPVKTAWLKIFDVVGTDTVFIRENGEEV